MKDKDYEEKYNCETCTKNRKLERYCEFSEDDMPPSEERQVYIDTTLPWSYVDRCPIALITEDVLELWDDFLTFNAIGHLPFPGGSKDQPNILIETFMYCKSLVDKLTMDPLYIKKAQKQYEERSKVADIVSGPVTLGDIVRNRDGKPKRS